MADIISTEQPTDTSSHTCPDGSFIFYDTSLAPTEAQLTLACELKQRESVTLHFAESSYANIQRDAEVMACFEYANFKQAIARGYFAHEVVQACETYASHDRVGDTIGALIAYPYFPERSEEEWGSDFDVATQQEALDSLYLARQTIRRANFVEYMSLSFEAQCLESAARRVLHEPLYPEVFDVGIIESACEMGIDFSRQDPRTPQKPERKMIDPSHVL